MAKVLISVFSNVTFTKEKYHDSFVQNFINVLERMGNDVMSIFGNDYTDHPFKFKTINYILKQELLEKVNKFNPDIIITFNNYFPCEEIITKTDCPIILYTADGCDFFAFQDLIKNDLDNWVLLNIVVSPLLSLIIMGICVWTIKTISKNKNLDLVFFGGAYYQKENP